MFNQQLIINMNIPEWHQLCLPLEHASFDWITVSHCPIFLRTPCFKSLDQGASHPIASIRMISVYPPAHKISIELPLTGHSLVAIQHMQLEFVNTFCSALPPCRGKDSAYPEPPSAPHLWKPVQPNVTRSLTSEWPCHTIKHIREYPITASIRPDSLLGGCQGHSHPPSTWFAFHWIAQIFYPQQLFPSTPHQDLKPAIKLQWFRALKVGFKVL